MEKQKIKEQKLKAQKLEEQKIKKQKVVEDLKMKEQKMREKKINKISVAEHFKNRADTYIRFEYVNLAVVVVIIGVGLFILSKNPEGTDVKDTSTILLLVVNKIVFLVLLLFLVRVFLKFQEFNTRRASLMNTIADAWSISDSKEEFFKMVEVILPERYESIKEFPDSKLENIVQKIRGK